MAVIPSVVGANTAGDSIETAALAFEKRFSDKPEDKPTPKPAETPPAEVETEVVAQPPAVEGEEHNAPAVEGEEHNAPAAEVETPAPEVDDEPVQPRKLKVKLPEGEQELPEDEVIKGYLRQQDYTRKTQEAAALRKQHEAELSSVKAERLKIAELTTLYHDRLVELTPAEPDWAKAKVEMEPADFAAAYASWDAHKKQIAEEKRASDEALAAVHADKVKEYEAHLNTERDKLFEALPEWKNETVRETERKAIGEYAIKELGYTAEDLNSVSDHRAMLVLRKAYLFDKAQADAKAAADKAGKKVEPGRVIAPKGGVTPPKDKAKAAVAEAKKRAKQSGSVDDAAAAFEALQLDD